MFVTHPEPPPDLATSDLPIKEVSSTWYRIHPAALDAIFFGRDTGNRFSAPAGEYGILYLGESTAAAFVETFGHATGFRFVQRSELAVRAISTVESNRPLRLVDVTGPGLARMGADNRLCDGDLGIASRWAMALHGNHSSPDGLYYRSRHDPSERCAALFNRASGIVNCVHSDNLADDAFSDELFTLLRKYDMGLC